MTLISPPELSHLKAERELVLHAVLPPHDERHNTENEPTLAPRSHTNDDAVNFDDAQDYGRTPPPDSPMELNFGKFFAISICVL